jgi:hypothetical protein
MENPTVDQEGEEQGGQGEEEDREEDGQGEEEEMMVEDDDEIQRVNNRARDGTLEERDISTFNMQRLFNIACRCSAASLMVILQTPEALELSFDKLDGHHTDFYLACKENRVNIVDLLLKRNEVKVNQFDQKDRSSPLTIACIKGNTDIVRLLIASPRVNVQPTNEGLFPLHEACASNNIYIVKLFLSSGRELQLQHRIDENEDLHCLRSCDSEDIRLLIQNYSKNRQNTLISEVTPHPFEGIFRCHPLPFWFQIDLPVSFDNYSYRRRYGKKWKPTQGSAFLTADTAAEKVRTDGLEFIEKTWIEDIEFYQSPTLRPAVATLQPGTRIQRKITGLWARLLTFIRGIPELEYVGHTIYSDLIFKEPSGDLITSQWDSSLYECPQPRPQERIIWPKLDELTYGEKLLRVLQQRSIFGQPLLSLLDFLHHRTPSRIPIAIVGGAIRDLLLDNEDKIQDVDIVIARPWIELEQDIMHYFAINNIPANIYMFLNTGVRKQFGMMKLNGTNKDVKLRQKTEIDKGTSSPSDFDIDIGEFKATRISMLTGANHSTITAALQPRKKKEKQNEYLYGYSYIHDAWTRDFTVNALYFDLFHRQFLDPTGEGYNDLVNRRICVTVKNQELLKKDLGGRFRLWKMLLKPDHEPNPRVMPIWICRELHREVIGFLNTPNPSPEQLEEGNSWIRKFTKKLYQGPRTAQILQDCISSRAYHQYMYLWWNETIRFCSLVVNNQSPYLATLTQDNPEDVKILEMCKEVAASAPITNLRCQEECFSTVTIDNFLQGPPGCFPWKKSMIVISILFFFLLLLLLLLFYPN